MALKRYTGVCPSNVGKDAKYSVTTAGEIRLVYRASANEKWLLSTADHAPLVEMVNVVKLAVNETVGGVFYINEFQDVLVPDGKGGGCYWAGNYDTPLDFIFEDTVEISPKAPTGLSPGDVWPGPHVGIRYTLNAGGNDLRAEIKHSAQRIEELRLSQVRGAEAAARLARRLAKVKGDAGGRVYINERAEFFAPATGHEGVFVYLGHLDEDQWFNAPEGFERP